MCAKGSDGVRASSRWESEHSAMASCIGASATGARTFTATSSQGLASHATSCCTGRRRAPADRDGRRQSRGRRRAGLCETDQNGHPLSQRDTGWIQLYCETNQEVLDTTIRGVPPRRGRRLLPVMIVLGRVLPVPHLGARSTSPTTPRSTRSCRRRVRRRLLARHHRSARVRLARHRPAVYMEMRLRQQEAIDRGIAGAGRDRRGVGASASAGATGAIERYRTRGRRARARHLGTITSRPRGPRR